MADEQTKCPRCEGVVDPQATRCSWCGGDLRPPPAAGKGLDIESWFESSAPQPAPGPTAEPELEILDAPPSPPPPVAEPAPEPLPEAALDPDDVPVVRRVSRRPAADLDDLPEARPLSAGKPAPRTGPVRPPEPVEEPEVPRPRVGLAVVVMLGLCLAVVGGCSVITYAIWAGFKAFSRPRKAEAPPAEVAPTARDTPAPTAPPSDQPGGGTGRFWWPPDRSFAVRPTTVTDTATVRLDLVASGLYPAGGGRYVVAPMPGARLIAVLDTANGRVAKYLPAPDPDPLVAAGMTKVFVIDPGRRSVRRFDLETGAEDLAAPLLTTGRPVDVAVGHAAAGPLAVVLRTDDGKLRLVLFDPDRLTPLSVELHQPDRPAFAAVEAFENPNWPRAAVRASADGHVLVVSGWDDRAGEAAVIELTDPSARVTRVRRTPGLAAPTADGLTVLGPDWVFRDGLVRASPRSFPAADGSGWFAVQREGIGPRLRIDWPGGVKGPVSAAVLLPGFPDRPAAGADEPSDRRSFLVPSAKLFGYLSRDRRAVELRRLDVAQVLAESDERYLVITSPPPRSVAKGARFTYRPAVATSAPAYVLALGEGAPPGMRVEGGQVVWDVPADFAQPGVRVRLTAGLVGRGRTDVQAFWLAVRPAGAAAPPVLDPPPPAGGRRL